MDLAVTERELHALLSEVAFTRQYGFRLHAIGDGECTLEVPFQELFERPGARVSGQVFMAAADVAMWLAVMTRLGCGRQVGDVGHDHGLSRLRPARGLPLPRRHPEAGLAADLWRRGVPQPQRQAPHPPRHHLYPRRRTGGGLTPGILAPMSSPSPRSSGSRPRTPRPSSTSSAPCSRSTA